MYLYIYILLLFIFVFGNILASTANSTIIREPLRLLHKTLQMLIRWPYLSVFLKILLSL